MGGGTTTFYVEVDSLLYIWLKKPKVCSTGKRQTITFIYVDQSYILYRRGMCEQSLELDRVTHVKIT